MKRPIAPLSFALIAVLLAACTTSTGGLGPVGSAAPSAEPSVGLGSPDVPPGSGSPSATPSSQDAPPPASTPPAGSTIVRAYFHLAGPQGSEGLVAVLRQTPETQAVARAAMNGLLGGPQGSELTASPAITSAIPAGTRLLGLSITNGIATVDLSREFEAGGGSRSAFGRLAQVVYTLTQFPSVKSVVFQVEGRTVTVFGSEGIVLDGPVGRMDDEFGQTMFEDLLPAIFVDRPTWGAALGNPGRVTGTANTFEAQFTYQLLSGSGRVLREGSVMATCGTGCRGTFDFTIDYTVSQAEWGTLRVVDGDESGATAGTIRDYPVWLTPAG